MSRLRAITFGRVTPLTGVVTEPAGGGSGDRIAVVLLNSGILHHVGANRLHVQLARRLAELGFLSLRFDFSGIGDSEARRDDRSFEHSAPLEVKDAIDYLQRQHGVSRIVLMGLCSGADVAHLTAIDEARVVGLGLLDPWAYRTRRYHLHYYGSRLVTPAVYRRWIQVRGERLRNRLARRVASTGHDPHMYEMPTYVREFPARERVAKDLQEFMRRGLELFCMFSGGLEEYNHLGQYRASFPEVDFGSRLQEAHVPNASHVFSALDHQAEVVRRLAEWTLERFGHRRRAETALVSVPTA
jgi:pimeloyl-ACP methyl ester carboxylesterase